jgi:branched-chain amino acid transport system permease protein
MLESFLVKNIGRKAAYALIIAGLIIMGITLPRGACSLLIHIMVFCIYAMGYDICLGFTNQTSLGHSVFFGIGAYSFTLPILSWQFGIIPALLASILLGTLVALVLGYISVRLSEAYFVIVTALFSAVFYLVSLDQIEITGGDDGLSIPLVPISLGPWEISLYDMATNYYFILILLVSSYFLLRILIRSPLGRVWVCIRENPQRTEFLGYNVFRYKLAAFTVSGLFAALAGALYAMTLRYTAADFFNIYWSIMPIVWCLVGGLGTLAGPCIGVFLMFWLQYYVSAWFTYYMIIFGVLILLILRVSRKGIAGFFLSKIQRYSFDG